MGITFRKLRKHLEVDFLDGYEKFTVSNSRNRGIHVCVADFVGCLCTLHIVLVRRSSLQARRFYIREKIFRRKYILNGCTARSSIFGDGNSEKRVFI